MYLTRCGYVLEQSPSKFQNNYNLQLGMKHELGERVLGVSVFVIFRPSQVKRAASAIYFPLQRLFSRTKGIPKYHQFFVLQVFQSLQKSRRFYIILPVFSLAFAATRTIFFKGLFIQKRPN